jgi:hypothetical protein
LLKESIIANDCMLVKIYEMCNMFHFWFWIKVNRIISNHFLLFLVLIYIKKKLIKII